MGMRLSHGADGERDVGEILSTKGVSGDNRDIFQGERETSESSCTSEMKSVGIVAESSEYPQSGGVTGK